MSIAVFVNPLSRANRRDPGLAGRFAEILADTGRVIASASLDDLGKEARALAKAPPTVIGIHGGDGTLHKTVSALIRGFGDEPLPPIAILTGGTMNVVAASLGLRVDPDRLLEELRELARSGQAPETITRRCLRIGDGHGFVFGNGMMATFLEEYYGKGKGTYGALRAIWILTRTFFSALVGGRYARKIFGCFTGTAIVDGESLPWRTLTAIGAATVREVGMGFKLNHRADEDLDRFSVLAVHARPLSLAPDLFAAYDGRGLAAKRAWSAVATRLVLEPDEGDNLYTVDGDLYRSRGRLEVSIGPALRFVKVSSAR